MKLDSAGNLTATSFNPTSDRNAKSNFGAVSPRAILDKLNSLPIQTWSYKADAAAVKHLGPVAQDFSAAFNLGADDKTISTVDADGVALAAIQGLYQMTVEQNRELARQVAELRSQVLQLQQAVKSRGRRRAVGRRQRP
jgi:trimeric autotransporter adhesin